LKTDYRYVWGGAAVGAIFGALAGWFLSRGRADEKGELPKERLARLLWSVVGVVREVVELG